MKKLFLIDGSGFIFRAYHALPPLQRPNGTPVGAVYGFCNMLSRLIDSIKDNNVLVVFDAARETFRQEIYPDYKAHRPPPPDDLIPQFSLIKESCDAFGIPSIEMQGFEADDLIATYAKKASSENKTVIIVSSDKDLMQLVTENVTLYDPIKSRNIGYEEVIEKFGVPPKKVIDVQALAGDSSDNVPGVAGIGVKTAAQLIEEYGSLEGLYENIDKIKQPKRKLKLTEDKEKAFISKLLVTLKDDVPAPIVLDDCFANTNIQKRDAFLQEQGFNSLINRLNNGVPSKTQTTNNKIEKEQLSTPKIFNLISPIIVDDADKLNSLKKELEKSYSFVFDTETTSLNVFEAELIGVSIFVNAQNFYIPIGHIFGKQLPKNVVFESLKPFFENESILKIAHNIKYDLAIIAKYGFILNNYDDTLLLSYSVSGNKHPHNLDALAELYLGHKTISFKEIVGEGKNKKTFDQVDIINAAQYACEDAQVTFELWNIFKEKLQSQKQNTLYHKIEKNMAFVTYEMENEGIAIDKNILHTLEEDFSKRIKVLEETIFQKTEKEFNIASPKQLGDILFNDLKLPGGKKTKSGTYSTDSETLENLKFEGHDIASDILDWRALSKLLSTYVHGLNEAIHKKTNRIHTSYVLTGTATGRFSSTNPNLQNIPTKTADGKKIRTAFVSKPDHKFISLDYSQIELRLLAHMAKIEKLQEAFKQSEDIHNKTASVAWDIPLENIASEQRYKAKAINFGIIYGISAFGLAKQLNCPRTEASQIIQNYLSNYPGILEYMEQQKTFAKENGFVETLFKRRCYTPDINNKNGARRQFSERQAINAPLQGTCADIIKLAMFKTSNFLKENSFKTKLLLTVHDELIFESPINEVDIVQECIKKIMENIVTLSIPLVVDVSVGNAWGDL